MLLPLRLIESRHAIERFHNCLSLMNINNPADVTFKNYLDNIEK
ncbi:hypothetical protein HMPREF0454_03654 [Hafnia alvei ATCC 51873]|uniref:Uncharacterized protein n=1 Tax=Hafnia alvei ATCC 51873 TaxID=1002364 RepID=G9YAN0_HAFAL|nr:hypothetical protein HMPREF0454_03654 [Hafnia alvei ATCC 51873]